MPTHNLKAAIEALLFMHHKPLNLAKMQELIDPELDAEEYRTALSDLMASYFAEDRGIELIEVSNGYQLRTKMEQRDLINRLFAINPMKLSQAMLEVLSIVAYYQPLAREKIEQIRGVDCSHLLRSLMDKKMLRMVGKSDEVGKPMLYGTTKEFLELFGLRDLGALPTLREIEDMLPANEVGNAQEEEEQLAQEMAEIVSTSQPLEFNDLELQEFEIETATAHESTTKAQPETKTHSHGSETLHNSAQEREAADDSLFVEKAPGTQLLGPEGQA